MDSITELVREEPVEKKKRVANFSESDKNLLLKLANSLRNIIENKTTNGSTWREKEKAWNKLMEQFNTSTSGPPRSVKQLKNKYELTKKEMKKRYSSQKRYSGGTGGGPYIPPPTYKTEEEKVLAETISLSIQGLQNEFDMDGIRGIQGVHPNYIESSEVADDIVIEYVEDDWSVGNTKLLRTPIHPVLQCINSDQQYTDMDEQPSTSRTVEVKENAGIENTDKNALQCVNSDHQYTGMEEQPSTSSKVEGKENGGIDNTITKVG